MDYPFRETDLVAASWFEATAEVCQIEEHQRENLWFEEFLEDLEVEKEDPPKVHPAQISAHTGSTTDSAILTLGQKLQDTDFSFSPRNRWLRPTARGDHNLDHRSFNDFLESYIHPPEIRLSQRDVTRWKLASRAAQTFREGVTYHNRLYSIFPTETTFSPRCENWPNLKDVLDAPFLQLGFVLAALVYGGLHALAWCAHFNTSTEQLLWRVSACIVMGGLPVVFGLLSLTTLLVVSEEDQQLRWYVIKNRLRNGRNPWKKVGICITYLPIPVVAIAYPLARAYLVVECFISLAHLPLVFTTSRNGQLIFQAYLRRITQMRHVSTLI